MTHNPAYEKSQTDAFSALVENGTYSSDFDHAPPAQEFFKSIMSSVLSERPKSLRDGVSVLDCGCGNGAWLDFLTDMEEASAVQSVQGFDLTPEMVAVAKTRLEDKAPLTNLQVGNILELDSYPSVTGSTSYDIVFTYDVIQQLPKKLQFKACETLVEHIAEGGAAVIFDNDCNSKFGRRMRWRKFLTRYAGLNLVPKYYCNASYPPLEKFAGKLNELTGIDVSLKVSDSGVKRAMIITRI